MSSENRIDPAENCSVMEEGKFEHISHNGAEKHKKMKIMGEKVMIQEQRLED